MSGTEHHMFELVCLILEVLMFQTKNFVLIIYLYCSSFRLSQLKTGDKKQ